MKRLRLFMYEAVPTELTEHIIARIRALEARALRLKVLLFGGASIASIVATVTALYYAGAQIMGSAFIDYVSLVISDTTLLPTLWREMLLSLAETIPIMSTLGVFVTVYALVWSLGHAQSYVRKAITFA